MRSTLGPLSRIIYTSGGASGLIRAACSRASTIPRQLTTRAALATEQAPAQSSMTVAASPVAGLEPAKVWGFFEQLTKIPRPSKHEEK